MHFNNFTLKLIFNFKKKATKCCIYRVASLNFNFTLNADALERKNTQF